MCILGVSGRMMDRHACDRGSNGVHPQQRQITLCIQCYFVIIRWIFFHLVLYLNVNIQSKQHQQLFKIILFKSTIAN